MLTASIVVYHNDIKDLKKVIDSSLASEKLNVLYIVDNSSERHDDLLPKDKRVEYIYTGENLGFGRAHNIAIKKATVRGSKYHVILNPDIFFDENVFEELRLFMEKNIKIGLVMPRVKFPNGEIQNLTKLLPTPFDLFQRRFLPRWNWAEKLNSKYEMNFVKEKEEIVESPYLSGCFMFIRTQVLKDVGLFDEKIFMYSEDLDLTRRIHEKYETVMYTNVEVYHKWERGSYKSKKLLYEQIKANIYYFNKYGWFFDRKRRDINRKILKKHLIKSRKKHV